MRRRHIIGLLVILAFLAFSVIAFSNSLTPYVNFAQAGKSNGSVQVRGVLADNRIDVIENGKKFRFMLRDESGAAAPVVYAGVKPDNFEHATSIVAVGRFAGGEFHAERLLVKCPSKYQGSVKN